MAPQATHNTGPQTAADLRLWCRQTRNGLRAEIDNYDEANFAGFEPIDVGPHPVAEAVRDAANYLADLENFTLARHLTAAASTGVFHEEALALLMQVEEWCIAEIAKSENEPAHAEPSAMVRSMETTAEFKQRMLKADPPPVLDDYEFAMLEALDPRLSLNDMYRANRLGEHVPAIEEYHKLTQILKFNRKLRNR